MGWMGGWVAGLLENKAISASSKVEVEVEVEFGADSVILSQM